MNNQWKRLEAFQAKLHKRFGTRILKKHHKGKRIDKAFNTSNFLHRNWIYIGELSLAIVLSCSTLIFGNGNTTPNNRELVYPLSEVSTIECRTKEWSTLTPDCKKELPIIKGANYTNYENNTDYTDIYTVLFWGSYNSGWKTDMGSHYGVDIATSKGTPLYAVADGKVFFAGQQAGYWNVVKIEFVYQGIRYFATYGHMDSITVKEGENVSKGQKIWTVGNSGLTMGGLGGYHVHFEIDKGEKWRPIYAFMNCADFKKGMNETDIINQGLCRTEMFNTTVDPIPLLESANAKLPHKANNNEKSEKSEPEHNAAPVNPVNKVDLADREQILKIAKLYLDSPYQMGATGTLPGNPTDCSKFTQNVFANVGIELERSAGDQAHQFSNGGYRYDNLNQAEIWDLLFFKNTYPAAVEITHVGIYAGNGLMIHAGNEKVELTTIDGYRKEHFKGIGSFKYLSIKYNKEKATQSFLSLSKIPNSAWLPAKQPEIKPIQPSPESIPNTNNQTASKGENLIALDSSKLDATGKQFFSEWNISLKGDNSSEIKKGETRIFTLEITKANWDKFNGVLKQPIVLVANSTNISIDPVAISLVKDGKVEIKLTANQNGPVYTAINMGTNRMGGMSMLVM